MNGVKISEHQQSVAPGPFQGLTSYPQLRWWSLIYRLWELLLFPGWLLEIDCTSKYTNFVFNFQVVIQARNIHSAQNVAY